MRASGSDTSQLAFSIVSLVFIFEYVRPHDLAGFLQPLRLPMVIALCAIGLWIVRGGYRGLDERLLRIALGFIAVCAFTIIFAPLSEDVYQRTLNLTKILFSATLPFIAFMAAPVPLLKFFRVWATITLLLALLVVRSGGVGPGSFLSDENDVGLALLVGLPFLWYLAVSPRTTSAFKRFYYYGGVVAVFAGVVSTGSRGTFVGVVGLVAYFWWNSKRRMRSLMLGLLAALALLVIAVPFLPDGYIDEMSTITDTNESTAQERLRSWGYGIQMFLDNPVFGVGAGNYPWVVQSYVPTGLSEVPEQGRANFYGRAAHSVYITVLAELGLTGSILFLLIVLGCAREIRAGLSILSAREEENETLAELRLYGMALGGALVGFLVGGAFISVLYYPHIWILIGFVVAFRRACEAYVQSPEPSADEPGKRPRARFKK